MAKGGILLMAEIGILYLTIYNVPCACCKIGWTRSVRCCSTLMVQLLGRWSRRWIEFRKSLILSEQTMQILILEESDVLSLHRSFLLIGYSSI